MIPQSYALAEITHTHGFTQAFHPDGSRTGSYSYVDPKGETILVKYRADRFGFHVLDGSSIPSTPPHVANAPAPAPAQAPQQAASDYVSTRLVEHTGEKSLLVRLRGLRDCFGGYAAASPRTDQECAQ